MNMQAVRQFAKTLNIETAKLSKAGMIKKIQLTEGNFDCYGSAESGQCDQGNCTWRSDCLGSVTAMKKTAQ